MSNDEYFKVTVIFDIVKTANTYSANFKSQTYDKVDNSVVGGATNKPNYVKKLQNNKLIYNLGTSRKVYDHSKYSKTFRRH